MSSTKKGSFFDNRDRLLEKKEKWNFECTSCASKRLRFHVLNKNISPVNKDDLSGLPNDYQKYFKSLPTIIDYVLFRTQGANIDIQIECMDCGETTSDFYNNQDGEIVSVAPSTAQLKRYLLKFYNYDGPLIWDRKV